MISIKELNVIWSKINPYKDGFIRVQCESELAFHIGYVNKYKCLMIVDLKNIVPVKSTKSIICDWGNMDNKYVLRFTLNNINLEELFVKLCWDLIVSSINQKNPLEHVIHQYNSWYMLLQEYKDDILPVSKQKGLLGELLYIKDLLKENNGTELINSWVGPEGADQDFNFLESWSEIKSVKIAATNVKISSLQQLDRNCPGKLVLYYLDKTSSNGENTISLPEIVKYISSHICDTDNDIFICKLAKYGYFEKDIDSYLNIYYLYDHKSVYTVNDNFPCLTRHNTPTEIENCNYLLNIGMIEKFLIREN